MNSTWELKEKSTGVLKVTVEGETWKKAQDKAFKKLATKLSLPGFRAGKVPTAMAKKYISVQETLMYAVDECATEALVSGISEHGLEMIAQPTLDVETINEEAVTLVFGVQVRPEVELGEYTNLGIKKDSTRVLKKDVEDRIAKLQERFAENELKEEGTVENGDTAVIDFEGFKDGVAFEGGKGTNYPLGIGSGAFIPGFEEQLVGMATGETKDITVTFPENYQEPTLAGKEVVFKVTVNEIKTKVLPEYNEELVKMANIENVTTVEEYEAHIKEEIKKAKEQDAETKYANDCLTAAVDNATVEVPQVLVDEEVDRMFTQFKQRLESQGFNFEMFSQMTGQDETVIRAQMETDALNTVKVRLVLDAVAKKEGIEVTEEQIEAEFALIAANYNMPVEEVKKYVTVDAVSYDLRLDAAKAIVLKK